MTRVNWKFWVFGLVIVASARMGAQAPPAGQAAPAGPPPTGTRLTSTAFADSTLGLFKRP
jgi:hypothetical protein